MNQAAPVLDLSEKGRGKDGQPISLDRRLFMQFMAFGGCLDTEAVVDVLTTAEVEGVLYADINDPQGIGLLTFSESADFFVTGLRSVLTTSPFTALTAKPEYTMLGRTYAIGHEQDLERELLHKPRQKVLNPEYAWAIWYPLQRKKEFELLPDQEKRVILMEHGGIGRTFGIAGLATDIRLVSYGLDKNDNDFVIALLGRELHPLSAVVQAMRKTKQTGHHLESLGPFFIGKAIWQSEV